MIALALARRQLTRPLVRATAAVAAAMGAWFAWSPGTRFGLVGAYGGWLFASIHLLDAALVPVVVVGALCGSTPRERRIDEQLRTAGLPPGRVTRAVVGSGAVAALGVTAAFLVGAVVGGWLRALAKGGSWWAAPGASAGLVDDLVVDARLLVGLALAGAIGALLGWIARRDDLAVALAALVTVGYLPELSAALGRLPLTIDLLSLSPVGALRAATLGDRGLAAPGYQRATPAVPYGLVLAGWCAVLVVAALPARPRRRAPAPTPDSSADSAVRPRDEPVHAPVGRSMARWPAAAKPTGRRVVTGLIVVLLTVAFGATVPGRAADALPWRWQRSWRAAEQAGWSSPQTVDRYLEARRSEPPSAVDELLAAPGAVSDAVATSIPRATRVEREPVATMAGPAQVTVQLDFASPIVSGTAAFSSYLVRFTLQPDADQHWRIVASEGPIASTVAPAGPGGGS